MNIHHHNKPIRIKYTEFQEEIRGNITGFTVGGKEDYLVVIDSTLPQEQQQYVLGHELAHIFLNHFDNGGGAEIRKVAAGEYTVPEELEAEAYRNAWNYYNLYINGKLT